jgi:hypothetical protein
MRSGKICQTSIRTQGDVKNTQAVKIIWNIGNGRITGRDSQTLLHCAWEVAVSGKSLDKVITFLTKVRKEMKKKRKK